MVSDVAPLELDKIGLLESLSRFPGGDSNKAATKSAAATLERWRGQAEGKEMVSEVFPVDVDNLFTMLFTSSKFYMDFHAAKKTTGENMQAFISAFAWLNDISFEFCV